MIDWVIGFADSPYGVVALFFMAFAESSFFPIPPDLLMIAMGLLNPVGSFFYALVSTVGSVLGGIFGYWIGKKGGRPLLKKYVSEEKIAAATYYFDKYEEWAIGIAGFTPIPYKVFTIAGGAFLINFRKFVLASFLGRAGRFFLVATALYFFGDQIKDTILRDINLFSIAFILLLVGGFLVIKRLGSKVDVDVDEATSK